MVIASRTRKNSNLLGWCLGKMSLRRCVCVCVSHSVMSNCLQPHGLYPDRLLCPWGFSWQEYWSGLPLPPQGDLPDPGIEPMSFMSPALAGRFFTTSATWEAPLKYLKKFMSYMLA